jgi:DNA-binding NtrC family response regulator
MNRTQKGKSPIHCLILTGWGCHDYAAAAAAALKIFGNKADVSGVSRRRLPELLGEAGSRWDKIAILGVSLSADVPALAKALENLKKKGVKVFWISAFDAPEAVTVGLADVLDRRIGDCESILDAVGIAFKKDVSEFKVSAADAKKPAAAAKKYDELIEAAQFAYRNYQDEEAYRTVIRNMAAGVKPEEWGPDVEKLLREYRRYGTRELIGKSLLLQSLQERINKVAAHPDARVLILGESGTGKETVAQQIHTKSVRKDEPFIAFNCASVNPELLASRFFGHEKGAFTGADRQTDGLFQMANGGTLFLDEIGELPPEAQALLLRVLEGGRFMRVGGREELVVDVRLITATHQNLPMRIRDGKFRADLFQRLNVVQLRVPSLREHKEDIAGIANAWWRKRHDNATLDEKQIAALGGYDYPGNVRELLNLLERATVLGETDFAALLDEHKQMNADLADNVTRELADAPDELDAAIRLHVRRVFDKCGQNLTKAAEALKVSRNTVRKYL